MQDVYSVGDVTVARLDLPAEQQQLATLSAKAAHLQDWQMPDLSIYEATSIYWGIYDKNRLVGGLQMTYTGPYGLPFESVWPDYSESHSAGVAEIVNLVVLAAEPNISLMLRCCVEMFRYCERHGIDCLLTAINDRRLRKYRRLGCPFRILGPQRVHWGIPSNLVGIDIPELRTALDTAPVQYREKIRDQWDR